ncbi:MAG: ElyC/SanA/YdcF family protein [Verrucomicrobiota bacterium]
MRPTKELTCRLLQQGWRWFARACAAATLILLGLAAIACVFPEKILPLAARLWSTAEVPRKADAIFILGGGVDFRPAASLQLWQEGYADKIYLFRPNEAFTSGSLKATIKLLQDSGMNMERVEVIAVGVSSTKDEASAAAEVVAREDYKHILIPTHNFHTRRTRWIFSKYIEDCEVIVTEAPYKHFRESDWWKNEWGVMQFQNEIAKTLYYWLRY